MAAHTIPLFLDCDPGIDDAIAIAYLLCQGDVEITGIAASGGNVSTAQVVRNTLGWLALAGRPDLPVHRGATAPLAHAADDAAYAEVTHGDTGSGYAALPESAAVPAAATAAQAWVEAARAHPGELIGVVIGPSTNLALALELEPDLPRLLRRLFVMGGAFNYRGNTLPTTEWNVSYDPEAAARVFGAFGTASVAGSAPHPLVVGPIEATEMVEMTPDRWRRIAEGAEGGAAWSGVLHELGEALRFYFEFHEQDGHGYLAHIHDPFVLAAALEWARRDRAANGDGRIPWAETALAPIDVELTGTLTRGETVADWLGRWERPAGAELIRRVEAGRFLEHLTDTLMKGPQHDRTR
ncbi:nucleoside hydrolase [Leucobacter allii]|uniref:Nucleoside hydrolase n=1 Tax=Leucobacter allii TaxID=2932247 RepID=A0ABY4FMX5_9MICO|nr:nucleoside hydrolase [Leucobacter allii]UOQ57625.1 nucleoside hydrolase [Leucobacter allii]